MKTLVLLISCLVLCWCSLATAQELPQLSIPYGYDIRVGGHFYYMPKNKLEMKGIELSNKSSMIHDFWFNGRTDVLGATYTYTPWGTYQADNAFVTALTHRLDVEWLKTGLDIPINPVATLMWSEMDFFSWKTIDVEKVVGKDTEGNDKVEQVSQTVFDTDRIHRLHGGLGLSLEAPIRESVTLKASAAYLFFNQRGWEASAGMSWTPGKLIKGEPSLMLGVTKHQAYYDWGQSDNLGFMVAGSLKF